MSVSGVLAGVAVLALLHIRFPPPKPRSKCRSVGPDGDAVVKEMESRISQLPDEILCLIISRLSAQDAVKTSILSRRWRHLYKFITQVRFTCCDMLGLRFVRRNRKKYTMLQQKFLEGVQTFLHHHSGCKITSFDLSCCSLDFFKCYLDKLFYGLGRVGVEQLKLSYGCDPECSFNVVPTVSCDLLCRVSSLKHLHLSWFNLRPNFAGQCNSLNILQLYHVKLVTPGAVECILSNCLSLQSLTMSHCWLPSKLSIHGSNLVLESLMIYQCIFLEEIRLNAINLITFEYCASTMSEIVFVHVPLLQNLSISFNGYGDIPYVFGELTKDLPHLKSLSFETSGKFYQGLKTPFVMNTFSNLRELVLSSSTQLDSDLLNISMILNVCPVLEKFCLWTKGITFHGPKVERSMTQHTELKEVELSVFSGTENELDFASYILESAVVLERMYINIGELGLDEERRKKICTELQEVAVSKTVKVVMQVLPPSYVLRSIFAVENNRRNQIAILRPNNNIFGIIEELAYSALDGVTGTLDQAKKIMAYCARYDNVSVGLILATGMALVYMVIKHKQDIGRLVASSRELWLATRELRLATRDLCLATRDLCLATRELCLAARELWLAIRNLDFDGITVE